MKIHHTFFLFLLGISACASQPTPFYDQQLLPDLSLTEATIRPALATVTPTLSSVDADSVLQPIASTTATPDLRLPPEQWRDWPVVPAVSEQAREIYRHGISQGKNPRAFSKIGDCQSIPASFLGIYDTDRYSFTPQYQHLQESVDYFSGSFNREGESVRGGFNTASVLLHFWANAAVCMPGENPMMCENRIHNPSMVFISLEVWFEGRTPDVYEGYMRRIIEYNIEQGTLPILATKADNVEGDHSINYTLAKLAHEYDIPLWNFWRSVQSLPNHGLNQNDTVEFHLNLDGWNMRSFSALQVLDTVRRAVTDLPFAEVSAVEFTPTARPSVSFKFTPLEELPYAALHSWAAPAPDLVPRIALGLLINDNNNQKIAGVYSLDLDAGNIVEIAGDGTVLLDVHEHGFLVAQEAYLFLIQSEESRLLSNQMLPNSPQPAIWLADGRIAAILKNGEAYQVAIISLDNKPPTFLPLGDDAPYQLYPGSTLKTLYWSSAPCSQAECAPGSVFASKLDGDSPTSLHYTGQPAFALDGKMAFMNYNAEGKNQLVLVDGENENVIQLPGTRLVNASWSPDGSTLAVYAVNVSDYSGRIVYSWLYFIDQTLILDGVLFVENESIEQLAWSPDGQSILVVRRPTQGKYRLNFTIMNSLSKKEDMTLGFTLFSETNAVPMPVFWIP